MEDNKTIVNDFFIPEQLYIDGSVLDHNLYPYKDTPEEINKLTPNDVVNDWLIDKVRIFNIATDYLVVSINNMISLKNSKNNCLVIKKLFRYEIRNICINMSMYFDKIRSLIGFYFFFNKKSIKYRERFKITLEQFAVFDSVIEQFILDFSNIENNNSWKWIYDIRNDEVHNDSLIERKNFDLSIVDGKLICVEREYRIDENVLLDSIKEVLELFLILRNDVQYILENIPSYKIYSYVKKHSELKGVIKPKLRSDINRDIPLEPKKSD